MTLAHFALRWQKSKFVPSLKNTLVTYNCAWAICSCPECYTLKIIEILQQKLIFNTDGYQNVPLWTNIQMTPANFAWLWQKSKFVPSMKNTLVTYNCAWAICGCPECYTLKIIEIVQQKIHIQYQWVPKYTPIDQYSNDSGSLCFTVTKK